MATRNVTIKDIAKEAKVSAVTVSMVLNNKPNISQATRDTVQAIAKKLNYRPNLVAKSLLSDKTLTLGVVTSNFYAINYASVWQGIESAASQNGYSVIFSSSDEQPEKEKNAIEILIQKRVDGILLVAPMCTSKKDLQLLDSFGIPYVMLLRRDPNNPTDACLNNNIKGGYEILDYLIETGSKKLFFLTFETSVLSGKERMVGYNQALQKHGLALDNFEIVRAYASIESGHAAMKDILENGLDADTIVCGCDLLAVGALEALRERSIKVPEEVRVVGYDDIELSAYISTPLTTVKQPFIEIGKTGVNILLERINTPQMPIKQIILDGKLITRKST